ncbi:MAG: hypothetical protein SWY16_25470 [Cyanobacteriota bacterium]|nr:hypothetical protein [Cyanobacteriota bacterium]
MTNWSRRQLRDRNNGKSWYSTQANIADLRHQPEQTRRNARSRSVVFHGFHENRDPSAETVAQIAEALGQLNPNASEAFVRSYLGNFLRDGNS